MRFILTGESLYSNVYMEYFLQSYESITQRQRDQFEKEDEVTEREMYMNATRELSEEKFTSDQKGTQDEERGIIFCNNTKINIRRKMRSWRGEERAFRWERHFEKREDF